MMPDPATLAVCLVAIFAIAFMKGAFGGGLAARRGAVELLFGSHTRSLARICIFRVPR
jgi:hypothetical protein